MEVNKNLEVSKQIWPMSLTYNTKNTQEKISYKFTVSSQEDRKHDIGKNDVLNPNSATSS